MSEIDSQTQVEIARATKPLRTQQNPNQPIQTPQQAAMAYAAEQRAATSEDSPEVSPKDLPTAEPTIEDEVATMSVTGEQASVIPQLDVIVATAAKMSGRPKDLLRIIKGVVARTSAHKVQTWNEPFRQAIIERVAFRLADEDWARAVCSNVLSFMHPSWARDRAYRMGATLAVWEALNHAVRLLDEEPLPGEDIGPAQEEVMKTMDALIDQNVEQKGVIETIRQCKSIATVRNALRDYDEDE